MMAQSRAESTRDTYNYGQYLNQFPPNTIKVIREFERIQKKIFRHKMSIMFNEICTYIYIYNHEKTQGLFKNLFEKRNVFPLSLSFLSLSLSLSLFIYIYIYIYH